MDVRMCSQCGVQTSHWHGLCVICFPPERELSLVRNSETGCWNFANEIEDAPSPVRLPPVQ